MERFSAINLLVDDLLPEDLRDSRRIYDKKGVSTLMTEIARRYPDRYPAIAKGLGDIGRKQAWRRGETFRLDDFRPVIDRAPVFKELDAAEAEIVKRIKDPTARKEALGILYGETSAKISKLTNQAALGINNNIALTVLSGARGKENQLRDLISTPGFYQDGGGKTIPGYIRNSFAEGLRPADYLAGTYAARSAVTLAKAAVAKGGFMAKTLARAAATTYVSEPDCGTSNGIDLTKDEPDLRGRVLQREAAGYPAGTVIDRKVLSDLQASKLADVIVRSPMTCQAKHGICGRCFGVKAEGSFPKVGEHVGVTASNALGEPLAQGALNTKHITSASGPKSEFSGLEYLGQFTESPEEFKDRSIVASTPGRVERIEPAPQGGNYVTVAGIRHYVPLDRVITSKVGDDLEAGDTMTDGLADPEDILKYKGLGEARNYWASKMAQIGKASGAGMDRRLFEVLARANVDHVELDDPEEDGFLPDDRVRYSEYVQRRNPSRHTQQVSARQAVGRYLEAPALHHTIGTKITPQIAEHLSAKGFDQVHVSEQEPGFKPVFIRLQQVAATDDDWLASQGASYLGNQLREGIGRAQDTNIEVNNHPVPRLVVGEGYADKLESTGQF